MERSQRINFDRLRLALLKALKIVGISANHVSKELYYRFEESIQELSIDPIYEHEFSATVRLVTNEQSQTIDVQINSRWNDDDEYRRSYYEITIRLDANRLGKHDHSKDRRFIQTIFLAIIQMLYSFGLPDDEYSGKENDLSYVWPRLFSPTFDSLKDILDPFSISDFENVTRLENAQDYKQQNSRSDRQSQKWAMLDDFGDGDSQAVGIDGQHLDVDFVDDVLDGDPENFRNFPF